MVYQHFTLVPNMTVAENLVLSRDNVPAVDRLGEGKRRARGIHATTPFFPLDAPVVRLAAGEKQKLKSSSSSISSALPVPRRADLGAHAREADEVLG